jgi:hypothetical protein
VSGRATITYAKAAGAERAEDEAFGFTLHAPATPGTFAVLTRQVYSDGTAVDWVGAAGDARPAPELVVADPAAPPSPESAPPLDPSALEPPPVAPPSVAPSPNPSATPPPSPLGTPTATPAARPAAVDIDVGSRMSWPAAAATVAIVVGGTMAVAAHHRRRQG